jgi:hypothetical protein
MANVTESLGQMMKIDGAIGAALADWETGLSLGTAGGGALDIETAAAANCQVVRAKMAAMTELRIAGTIHDMLITLDTQIHMIRPLTRFPQVFLYFAAERDKCNLALARMKLAEIEKGLSI